MNGEAAHPDDAQDEAEWPSHKMAALARVVALVPVAIAGLMAALVLSSNSPVQSWLRRVLWSPDAARRRRARQQRSLASMKQAILGNSKQAVVAVLGAPRTSTYVNRIPVARPDQPVYWDADTWYYPLNRRDRSAMAIHFLDGIAQSASVIHSPLPSRQE